MTGDKSNQINHKLGAMKPIPSLKLIDATWSSLKIKIKFLYKNNTVRYVLDFFNNHYICIICLEHWIGFITYLTYVPNNSDLVYMTTQISFYA